MTNPDWYETYFGSAWLCIERSIDERSTRREADCAMAMLELRLGMHVADIPCGAGRDSIVAVAVA